MNERTKERTARIDTLFSTIHDTLCDLLCTVDGNSLTADEHVSIAAAYTANYKAGTALGRAMRGLAPPGWDAARQDTP